MATDQVPTIDVRQQEADSAVRTRPPARGPVHPQLSARLKQIRRQILRVLLLYGLSWLVTVVLGTALAAGLADWLLHLDDPGVRLILGMGILAGGGCVAWRFLISPLLVQFSDVDVALRIERRFPGFNDSLASTVQFSAGGTDPRLGSPELQSRVIEKTIEQIDRVDMTDVVTTRAVRGVAGTAVLVCLLTAVVVGWNKEAAARAFKRLVLPLQPLNSLTVWPKKFHLQLLDVDLQPLVPDSAKPLTIAQGDTLELFVENLNGPLPEDVSMQYNFTEANVISERLRRTTLRDPRGQIREVGVATLVVVKGPMWFRAVGGDDDTPWHELRVVPPPLADDLQVTLTPPAYAAGDPERLPSGVGHVQGLVGTRVDVKAGANKPLKSARLRLDGKPPQSIQLSKDGLRLETSFVIEKAGTSSYWFDLKDRQGFHNSKAPRYEIRGIADLPPDIYIDKPASDMQVTSDAEILVRVVARDDLGLNDVRLRYNLSETDAEAGIVIPLPVGAGRPRQFAIEHNWNLGLLPLVPGMRIVYHAEATDDFDLGPEHVGLSIARALSIVSPEAKADELASRQASLLDELERILKMQIRARDQVGELLLQLGKVGSLRSTDVDMLKRIEMDERQISSRLLNPTDGIESRVLDILFELQNNHIDDPRTQQRLERIAGELSIVREELLPALEQHLTQARKAVQIWQPPSRSSTEPTGTPTAADRTDSLSNGVLKPGSGSTGQAASLTAARTQQNAVIESLDTMIALLSQWRHTRDLTGELDEIITGQKEVRQQTGEIGRHTRGKSRSALTTQEQADLAKLAGRQQQRAQQVEQFRKRIAEAARELAESDRTTAEMLSDTGAELDRHFIAGGMREAARELERNRIGRATDIQQQVLDDLAELQNILRRRGATDTETLVKKLRQEEQELIDLKKRQEELLERINRARDNPNPDDRGKQLQKLGEEQQQLGEAVSRMSRRLRRLQAHRSCKAAGRAASGMQQARRQLQEDAAGEAADELREALEDLRQTQRELARERHAAELQLARQLLERIADEMAGMIARQQNVINETARLDAEYRQKRNWSRTLLKSLRDLAETQQTLKQETDRLAEQLTVAEVFALALRGAARHMQTAADRLSSRQTDDVTISAQKAAKQRFVDLIAALNTDKPNGAGGASNVGGAADEGSPQELLTRLAQLKMLKTVQEDINQQTRALDVLRQRNGGLTPGQQDEAEALAIEQGQLALLTQRLRTAVTEAFETEDGER